MGYFSTEARPTVRVHLSDEYWVDIYATMTRGEKARADEPNRRLDVAMVPADDPKNKTGKDMIRMAVKPDIDLAKVMKVAVSIAGWNLTDESDRPISLDQKTILTVLDKMPEADFDTLLEGVANRNAERTQDERVTFPVAVGGGDEDAWSADAQGPIGVPDGRTDVVDAGATVGS